MIGMKHLSSKGMHTHRPNAPLCQDMNGGLDKPYCKLVNSSALTEDKLDARVINAHLEPWKTAIQRSTGAADDKFVVMASVI